MGRPLPNPSQLDPMVSPESTPSVSPFCAFPALPLPLCGLHKTRPLVLHPFTPPLLPLPPLQEMESAGIPPLNTLAMELRVGRKYRLGKKIGSGSFGGAFRWPGAGALPPPAFQLLMPGLCAPALPCPGCASDPPALHPTPPSATRRHLLGY